MRLPTIYYAPEGAGMAALNGAGGASGGGDGASGGGVVPPSGAGDGTVPPVTSGAPPSSWYDNAFAPLVQQKGWQNATDALKGYQNLETLLGEKANAIVPPKSDADANEWSKFYQKLGAPADATLYKFDKTGMDPTLVNEASKWFQGAGLNDKQAEGLLKQYNEFVGKDTQTRDTEFMTSSSNDLADLQKEWGGKFEDTVELARRATQFAMKEAGLTPEQLNSFERAVGTKTMLKMMAGYGNMFKEGVAPGGGQDNTFRATPEFAKSEINRLRNDPGFMTRYNHSNPTVRNEAIKEMETLSKQAYGDAPIG